MQSEIGSVPPDAETESVDASAERPSGEAAISVTDLEKVYGDGADAVRAVDGVSFDVEPGTAVGILGPNGAGKTTVIKSILSLIVPTNGRIEVAGTDVFSDSRTAFRRMGAMLEGARNTYWRLTVRENIEMFTVIGGHDYRKRTDRIDELLAQFNLEEKAETVVRELSRGQKQKVTLACTMARDADVVFLDEPTLGLDIESSLDLRRELRRLVEDDGSTVVLSSHDMDVVQEVCDRIIIMNEGEVLVDDSVENLLDVFDTQSYEITVAGGIEADVRERLRSEYGVTDFEQQPETTRFEVNIVTEEFFTLVDEIRAAGLTVQSFDSVEANLEEIFLQVTDRSGEGTDE